MEPGIWELSGMIGGFTLGTVGTLKPEDPEDFFYQTDLVDPPVFFPGAKDGLPTPPESTSPQGLCPEDSEIFSDIALSYISEMLLEEGKDDKVCVGQGGYALQEAVRPFYEALGEQLPPSPDQNFCLYADSSESPEDSSNGHSGNSGSSSDGNLFFDSGEHPSPQIGSTVSVDYNSQTSFSSSKSFNSIIVDGLEEIQFIRTGGEDDLEIGFQPMWQYRRGVEEAIKFLPDQSKLVIDVDAYIPTLSKDQKLQGGLVEVKVEKEDKEHSLNLPSLNRSSRSRKNPHDEDSDLEEGRNTKQSAMSTEDDVVRSEMFDQVLLCPLGRPNDAINSLREALQNEVKASKQNGHSKGPNGGKSRRRTQPKKEVVDLRTLLIHCAQAVATDDRWSAGELLKQIRQHSSPTGDGPQRLAHIFADGLEARIAGTGTEIYHSLVAKRQSAVAILKAYHLYLAACPFKKISDFFSNQTILDAAEGADQLHIVDFGIYFGFQWPCLIQRLSLRPGGPPKLRITGIDVPQPGFRPAERVEETGRRLADYARTFGVPFEYHAIASNWESIEAGDLKIEKDEVLVVNCLYRLRNLVDETVVVDSPRTRVLHNIRKMNPDVFIHGVVNGAYGAPYFVTRFKEALFHFSALFDMLEATVPGDHPERLLIEREIFRREAMNVIACEGAERVERPEAYKQWQGRNLRAGFEQRPLDRGITRKARDKVRACYDKDFLIDEDGGWLLQGWKGRIIYAICTWRPNPIGF